MRVKAKIKNTFKVGMVIIGRIVFLENELKNKNFLGEKSMKINNTKNIAGIKIRTDKVSADLIKLIKEYRNDAISDIRNDILNYDYVYACSFTGKTAEFEKLLNLYNELISLGYEPILFDENKESNIEYFNNWLESCRDTDKEIEDDDSFTESN